MLGTQLSVSVSTAPARACRACRQRIAAPLPPVRAPRCGRQPYVQTFASASQPAQPLGAGSAAPVPGSWASARSPQERKRLLLAVVKPPIYTVALVPVLVGFAAAFYDTGAFLPGTLAAYITCACLVIVWLNLSNDAWDAETDVDVAKTESAVRLTGSVSSVHNLAGACLLLGGSGLGALALSAPVGAAATILPLLSCALLCGVLYQAPPFRWSYKGLGEPLCFISFGPLATCAFYLAAAAASPLTGGHTALSLASVSPAACVASLLVGCTTTAILFCSHFHQEKTDKAAGKQSPIVRLGTAKAAQALRLGVLATYALSTSASLAGWLPLPVACGALLAAPVARTLLTFVGTNHGDPGVVFKAKFFATRWHASTGLLLTLAFAAARLLAR